MEVHEIGTYSSPKVQHMKIFMLQHDGGVEGSLGHRTSPAVVYNMECDSASNFLFWPDWLAFAHAVNAMAGEQILDPMSDMAEELGITVATGLECPACGCRVMDALEWVELEDTSEGERWVFCHGCEEPYHPGEN